MIAFTVALAMIGYEPGWPAWLAGIGIGALVGFALAQNKGQPWSGAFLGAVFGPLGWLFIAISRSKWRCPWCHGNLDSENVAVCRHCGRDIAAFTAPDVSS